MTGQKKWVVWDDWSGGEFGDTPLRQVQSNQYTALNLMVYRNGELGPRPGIKSHSNTSIGNGVITGMGFTGTGDCEWWVTIASTVVGFNSTDDDWTVVVTYDGGLGSSLAAASVAMVNGINTVPSETYFGNSTDRIYRLATSANAISVNDVTQYDALSPSTEHSIAIYRDRLFVGDSDGVVYSAPGDFGTWPSSGNFKVGHGKGVRFLGAKGDALMIVTADGSIWEYRGTPGSDTLRRVYNGARHPWVMLPGRAIVLPNDDMIMVPIQRDYPALFSGGRLRELTHLKMLDGKEGNAAGDADEWKIVETNHDDGCLILSVITHPDTGGKRAMERRHGIWSFYEWGVSDLTARATTDRQHQVLLTDGGGASTAAEFYTYDPSIDRPGYTSDTYATVGDASSTPETNMEMTTATWWADEGQEITVKRIIIDFTKYQTGQSETTHFDVDVIQYGEHITDDTNTVSMQAFDQANASATTAGEQDRHITGGPSGGAIPCSGFQIKLSAIRAVGIQSIRVEIEQNPLTPRY